MWLPPVTTVAPVGEVVTLAQAKEFCRLDSGGTGFDSEVRAWIAKAVDDVERWTGTRLLTQTVMVTARRWDDLAALPIGPVASIGAITYLESLASLEQTLAVETYELAGAGLAQNVRRIVGEEWPALYAATDAVRVTLTVGYGAAAAVPAGVWVEVLKGVRCLFEGKEWDPSPGLANHRIWL